MNFSKTYGIILTGIEGTGKTIIGRELAHAWGWRCLDADDLNSILSGMSLDEAMRLIHTQDDWTAREIVEHRRALLNEILSRKPKTRLILPTTLRPVLLVDPKSGRNIVRLDVARSLEKNWIILYLIRDIDQVAQYFLDHPEARRRRQRLDGCETNAQIKDMLWKFQKEMAPYYAKLCHGIVSLTGNLDEDMNRVANEAFRRILPPEME